MTVVCGTRPNSQLIRELIPSQKQDKGLFGFFWSKVYKSSEHRVRNLWLIWIIYLAEFVLKYQFQFHEVLWTSCP